MNPLQLLLSALSDGQGNTSMTRVVLLLVTLAVLSPKIAIAIKTGVAPIWSDTDLELLGVAFGAKLIQNGQENAHTT